MISFLTIYIYITSENTCTLFKIMIFLENGQIIAIIKSVIKLCNQNYKIVETRCNISVETRCNIKFINEIYQSGR